MPVAAAASRISLSRSSASAHCRPCLQASTTWIDYNMGVDRWLVACHDASSFLSTHAHTYIPIHLSYLMILHRPHLPRAKHRVAPIPRAPQQGQRLLMPPLQRQFIQRRRQRRATPTITAALSSV